MPTAAFWHDVAVSLSSIVEGVAIGSVAGILVGVAMGRVREVDWFLSTYIRALYALPLIALVPIVILWVGYQPAARLIIVVISAFLPVAVTTADGTRAISKDYLDVGKMFGARTHNVWFGIALPRRCRISWPASSSALRAASPTPSRSRFWPASTAWACRCSPNRTSSTRTRRWSMCCAWRSSRSACAR